MPPFEQISKRGGGAVLPRHHRLLFWFFVFIFCVAVASLVAWSELVLVPSNFPVQQRITIPSGAPLHAIAISLEETHVIHSPIAFILLVKLQGAESRIIAGDYLFSSALPLRVVTERLITGEHGIARVRITVPEGTSVAGMGRIFKKTFFEFDDLRFSVMAKESEGYLFPDTYFFFVTATSGPIFDTLKNNFLLKTELLRTEAIANKKSWSDIVIMASIIEEEAITPEDRRIISGILWKRLEKKMHLQVDAPFAYAIGKNSATLTALDLTIDSPYNTYRYGGLPPTPISNPGLDAIDAALHPKTSPYFFYLSGKDGVIHYAKTFAEHKLNKERYLR